MCLPEGVAKTLQHYLSYCLAQQKIPDRSASPRSDPDRPTGRRLRLGQTTGTVIGDYNLARCASSNEDFINARRRNGNLVRQPVLIFGPSSFFH